MKKYITQAEYSLLKKQKEDLIAKKVRIYTHKAMIDDSKDKVSPGMNTLLIEENMINAELARIQAILDNVTIIEPENNNVVGLGDIVELEFVYGPGDSENIIVKMVVSVNSISSEVQEITSESAIGQAIFGHSIGEELNCVINGATIGINIKRKLGLDETLENQPVSR